MRHSWSSRRSVLLEIIFAAGMPGLQHRISRDATDWRIAIRAHAPMDSVE